jgi:hypothetical protein
VNGPFEWLLAECVRDFGISSTCIPSAVRRQHPELEAAGERLSLQMTLTSAGDEQLIVVPTEADEASVLGNVAFALRSFELAPYLILVSGPAHPEQAPAAAEALISASPAWLLRDDLAGSGAVLLAPVERLLSLAGAPGEWRAGPKRDEQPNTEDGALEVLWQAIERDRDHLEVVSSRLREVARELEDTRRIRDRLAGELARMREGERNELDRVRMAMLDQRVWVAEQARRIAASTSWRVGHRLVRVARALAFRRDRGTDLPAMIAKRMDREELP